ncbi:MAG: response regulator [Myxococcales bacterium]|nr:response regulator [Myxococcales bacterium]
MTEALNTASRLSREGGQGEVLLLNSHKDTFDLLCVDGVMPGASCKSVINRFRDDYPGKPVLVCSGYLAEELVRREIYTGEIEFLAKPFTGDALVAKLEEMLGGTPTETV